MYVIVYQKTMNTTMRTLGDIKTVVRRQPNLESVLTKTQIYLNTSRQDIHAYYASSEHHDESG